MREVTKVLQATDSQARGFHPEKQCHSTGSGLCFGLALLTASQPDHPQQWDSEELRCCSGCSSWKRTQYQRGQHWSRTKKPVPKDQPWSGAKNRLGRRGAFKTQSLQRLLWARWKCRASSLVSCKGLRHMRYSLWRWAGEARSPWTTVSPLGIWKLFHEGEVRVSGEAVIGIWENTFQTRTYSMPFWQLCSKYHLTCSSGVAH